jgi:hypothetical protein
MLNITDEHNTNGTIDIEGVWVYTYPSGQKKIGAYLGEVWHCVNHLVLGSDGEIALSKISFGVTYSPTNGLESWDVREEKVTVEKIICDNKTLLTALVKNTGHENILLRKYAVLSPAEVA